MSEVPVRLVRRPYYLTDRETDLGISALDTLIAETDWCAGNYDSAVHPRAKHCARLLKVEIGHVKAVFT